MTSENKNNRAKKKQPGTKRRSKVKVKDYGNDPFFVKKAEQSKAFLEKHGFPEDLVLKK